jgi:hypothetical protein
MASGGASFQFRVVFGLRAGGGLQKTIARVIGGSQKQSGVTLLGTAQYSRQVQTLSCGAFVAHHVRSHLLGEFGSASRMSGWYRQALS